MGATKRMDQILHILKTYQRTRSIKATARATGGARNTVRTYLRLAAARDPDLNVVLKLPNDQLRQIFFPGTPATTFDREAERATDASSMCSTNGSTSSSNHLTCSPLWTTTISGEPMLINNLHCTPKVLGTVACGRDKPPLWGPRGEARTQVTISLLAGMQKPFL